MGVPEVSEDPNAGAAMRLRAESEGEAGAPVALPTNPKVLGETEHPRMVVLGIDGLDPDILKAFEATHDAFRDIAIEYADHEEERDMLSRKG